MRKASTTLHGADEPVRAAVLAEMLGISERAIRSLAERGIVQRTPDSLYPFAESIRAYCHHLREAAAGRGGQGAGSKLTAEREREVRERADHLALRNAQARGEMLPAVDVERRWSIIIRVVRSRMLSVPSRVRQSLGHLTAHDVAVIDREIRAALTELGHDDL